MCAHKTCLRSYRALARSTREMSQKGNLLMTHLSKTLAAGLVAALLFASSAGAQQIGPGATEPATRTMLPADPSVVAATTDPAVTAPVASPPTAAASDPTTAVPVYPNAPTALPPLGQAVAAAFVSTVVPTPTTPASPTCTALRDVAAATEEELTTFTLPLLVGGGTFTGHAIGKVLVTADDARVWRTVSYICEDPDHIEFGTFVEDGVVVLPYKRGGYKDVEIDAGGTKFYVVVHQDQRAVQLRNDVR